MARALIIGGTGQVGLAAASRLTSDGWDVTIACRRYTSVVKSWNYLNLDASQIGGLAKVINSTFDLIISCIAFCESDAIELLSVQNYTDRLVVISSASVYCDNTGRTLDEAVSCGFPEFTGAITEQTPTVEPSSETYSTKKIGMERVLLNDAKIHVTILRPCAIHGPYSKHAREWWFVKRLLDGQKRIPLAYQGRSQFQTTSTSAIASAIVSSASGKLPEIANVSDADSPTVRDIGRAIMSSMGTEAELVGLTDNGYPTILGATPWSVPKPFILRSAAVSKCTYSQSVGASVQWLIDNVSKHDWQKALPQLAAYPRNLFDYHHDAISLD